MIRKYDQEVSQGSKPWRHHVMESHPYCLLLQAIDCNTQFATSLVLFQFSGNDNCHDILVALGVTSGTVIIFLLTALIVTLSLCICKHQGNHF